MHVLGLGIVCRPGEENFTINGKEHAMIQVLKRTSLVLLGLCVVAPLWANSLKVTSAAAMSNLVADQPCSGDGQPGPCGLQVDATLNDSTPAYVETTDPNAENGIRVTFWLDPNSQKKGLNRLDMNGAQNVRVLKLLSTFPKPPNASSIEHTILFIKRNFVDDNYRIRLMVQQNYGFYASCAEGFFSTDGGPAKKITVEWVQGQGSQGSQDGRCSLYIDDVLLGQKTNLNTSEFNVNSVRLGIFQPSDPASTSGTYFIDEVAISGL